MVSAANSGPLTVAPSEPSSSEYLPRGIHLSQIDPPKKRGNWKDSSCSDDRCIAGVGTSGWSASGGSHSRTSCCRRSRSAPQCPSRAPDHLPVYVLHTSNPSDTQNRRHSVKTDCLRTCAAEAAALGGRAAHGAVLGADDQAGLDRAVGGRLDPARIEDLAKRRVAAHPREHGRRVHLSAPAPASASLSARRGIEVTGRWECGSATHVGAANFVARGSGGRRRRVGEQEREGRHLAGAVQLRRSRWVRRAEGGPDPSHAKN